MMSFFPAKYRQESVVLFSLVLYRKPQFWKIDVDTHPSQPLRGCLSKYLIIGKDISDEAVES
jgi:hypothetical protein